MRTSFRRHLPSATLSAGATRRPIVVTFDAGTGNHGRMTSDPVPPPVPPKVPPTAGSSSIPPGLDEPPLKFTRAGALWSALTAGFLVLIVLLIFITQNTDSAEFAFLGWHWSLPLGVAILLAAVCGGLADGGGRHRAAVPAAPGREKEPQGRDVAVVASRYGSTPAGRRDPAAGRPPQPPSPPSLFSVIEPLWLSRKAVSAASRPVVMRTNVCRGARRSRRPPAIARRRMPRRPRGSPSGDSPAHTPRRDGRGRSPPAIARPPDARSRGTHPRPRAGCRPRRRSDRLSPARSSAGSPPTTTPSPAESPSRA